MVIVDDGLSSKTGLRLCDVLVGRVVDRRGTPMRLFFPRMQWLRIVFRSIGWVLPELFMGTKAKPGETIVAGPAVMGAAVPLSSISANAAITENRVWNNEFQFEVVGVC